MIKRYRMRATLKGEYEVPNAESFPHEDGAWVLWKDHLEEVNNLKDRIIGLIKCVHGEFCSTSLKYCQCGIDIRELGRSELLEELDKPE